MINPEDCARQEGYDEGFEAGKLDGLRIQHEGYAKVRNEALEEAANVAETYVLEPTNDLQQERYRNAQMKFTSERIRALKGEDR